MLSSPKGNRLCYALQIHFAASNNVAEYKALVHGLRLSKELGIRRILCYGDSDLVVQQCSFPCMLSTEAYHLTVTFNRSR